MLKCTVSVFVLNWVDSFCWKKTFMKSSLSTGTLVQLKGDILKNLKKKKINQVNYLSIKNYVSTLKKYLKYSRKLILCIISPSKKGDQSQSSFFIHLFIHLLSTDLTVTDNFNTSLKTTRKGVKMQKSVNVLIC
jgi:hypothetical protein